MSRSLQSFGNPKLLRIALTILLLVVVQLPIPGWIAPGYSVSSILRAEPVYWVYTALILAFVLLVERRPLSSIGLRRPTWRTLLFGLLAAAIAIVGSTVLYVVVFPALKLSIGSASISTVQALPLWFRALLLVRAPVFEEIFYRGFAIERLTEITGKRWLAATISGAAFTYAHLSYWGWVQLIVVAYETAVLTVLYLLRRDLGSNMIAHFTADLTAFLVM
jgi:uncharacterized protein